jgi:ABC-2 type transport system permease protein
MGLDAGRTVAVLRKELLDYRRNRAIVVTMSVLPLLFLLQPIISIFLTPADTSGSALDNRLALSILYLLLTSVVMPATLAAYCVAGEREQGTLEPLLTTPIRRGEFILGKAAAVMLPTVALSYVIFGIFFTAVALFAHPVVASAVFHDGPVILALFLLAPLVAGWAIVVGMAVSVRAREVRVAQQLGTLASLPIVGVVVLLAVGVIHPTFIVAVEFAAGLLAIDALALRMVSGMFDRERLVTGVKAARSRTSRLAQLRERPATGERVNGEGKFMTTATLKLSRRWGGLIDRTREWQVSIDGTIAGSIASQQTIELPVQPGRHTLRLSAHRHVSPERSFEASEGEVVGFWCRAAMLWPIYIAALIKPDLWITLRQD